MEADDRLIARLTGWATDPTGIPQLLRDGHEIVNPLAFDGDMIAALAAISARHNTEWEITILSHKPMKVLYMVCPVGHGGGDPCVSNTFIIAAMEAIRTFAATMKSDDGDSEV